MSPSFVPVEKNASKLRKMGVKKQVNSGNSTIMDRKKEIAEHFYRNNIKGQKIDEKPSSPYSKYRFLASPDLKLEQERWRTDHKNQN